MTHTLQDNSQRKSKPLQTKQEVFAAAQGILGKSLADILIAKGDTVLLEEIRQGENKNKGLLGGLIEWHVFNKKPDSLSQPDFSIAGVEIKTNPLKKHSTKTFVSKERLVFSMIDYNKVVTEEWDTSSFLKKNKLLLLMFYLYNEALTIADFQFKFVELFDMLSDISDADILQIKKDWEFIVSKIRNKQAHLLSEGDTYYLGACTKGKDSTVMRSQPGTDIKAKPRAFSLKQQYLNYLIQKKLLKRDDQADSILEKLKIKKEDKKTIEQAVHDKLAPYIGKSGGEIMASLKAEPFNNPKNYKRLLVNRMLGVKSNNIEEFEKSNITLRVVTLEPSGSLTESISFPAFDYKELIKEVWENEQTGSMSEFHELLETQRFLFVVFQKVAEGKEIVLKSYKFWNFPAEYLTEARRVWELTVQLIKSGDYANLPGLADSSVAHVRPHGADGDDRILTPQGTLEIKLSFWLNAKYIQKALEG